MKYRMLIKMDSDVLFVVLAFVAVISILLSEMSVSCDPMKETLVSSSFSFALILSIVTGGVINASAASLMSSITTATATTATPIKHLVIIFQENISYDYYFGTYPNATNPQGRT